MVPQPVMTPSPYGRLWSSRTRILVAHERAGLDEERGPAALQPLAAIRLPCRAASRCVARRGRATRRGGGRGRRRVGVVISGGIGAGRGTPPRYPSAPAPGTLRPVLGRLHGVSEGEGGVTVHVHARPVEDVARDDLRGGGPRRAGVERGERGVVGGASPPKRAVTKTSRCAAASPARGGRVRVPSRRHGTEMVRRTTRHGRRDRLAVVGEGAARAGAPSDGRARPLGRTATRRRAAGRGAATALVSSAARRRSGGGTTGGGSGGLTARAAATDGRTRR